jgi:toxin YoeB
VTLEATPWVLAFTKQAQKDAKKAKAAGFKPKIESLLAAVAANPYRNPPHYERLVGDLAGAISRRINIQQRLVYQVMKQQRKVKILRMWTHYE